jgi:hypothetical protein
MPMMSAPPVRSPRVVRRRLYTRAAWTTLLAVGCCGSAFATTNAQAAEPSVPAAVTSLFDDQACGLLSVDTTRLDIEGAIAQVVALPLMSERDREDVAYRKKNVIEWLKYFRGAGGRDLWVVFSLADDLANSAFVVVPLHDGANRQVLEKLFLADKHGGRPGFNFLFVADASLERDGSLIFGSKRTIERLTNFHGPVRTIPPAALEAVAGREIQAFVLPTDDHRRVLSEFLRHPEAERRVLERLPAGNVPPELARHPGDLGRLALGDGLQWIAAGLVTQNPLGLKVTIGSKDATSAQALGVWLAGAWQVVIEQVTADKTPHSKTEAAILEKVSQVLMPKVEGSQLTVQIDLKQLMASTAGTLLGQAAVGIANQSEAVAVKNYLKQLSLAMHNYHDVNSHFPAQAIRDADSRPLLSWRVAILPYIDQQKLYHEFHLNESWDSPQNKQLIERIPAPYQPASAQLRAEGKTTILVPVGKDTIFGAKEGLTIKDIPDGTSNTIFIVNADRKNAVPWTKPEDLNVDNVDAKAVLFGDRKDGFAAATADGAAHFVGPSFTSVLLRAMLTRDGREPIVWPDH